MMSGLETALWEVGWGVLFAPEGRGLLELPAQGRLCVEDPLVVMLHT